MNAKQLLLTFLLSFTTLTIFAQSPFSGELEVSKGYFANKILVNWKIEDNTNINSFNIERRQLKGSGYGPWVPQGNFSANERRFEDVDVEGGVLHEYKVQVVGNDQLIVPHGAFVTGIGLRSPTAIVTGNVSFLGGAPVEGVTVSAKSQGGSSNVGSAIKMPSNGSLSIDKLLGIEDEMTFQAWVKPDTGFNKLMLFDSSRDVFTHIEKIDVDTIQIRTDLHFFKLSGYYPTGEFNSKGQDSLRLISTFSDRFNHISVVLDNNNAEGPQLYINGIAIYHEMELGMENDGITPLYPYPGFAVVKDSKSNDEWVDMLAINRLPGSDFSIDKGSIGRGASGTFDEIRIWKAALSAQEIKENYNRYIDGNDARLLSYLRLDEGLGDFAYDISRDGSFYNKNHFELYYPISYAETPPITGNVLTNDIAHREGGTSLRVTSNTVTTARLVEVTIDETGAFTYLPINMNGDTYSDSFEYQIIDSLGNLSMATVYLEMLPIGGALFNEAPIGNYDSIYTYDGTTVTGNVLGNDYDPNGNTLTVTTTPVTNVANGTLVLNADGSYTYTPLTNPVSDFFAYQVCDTSGLCVSVDVDIKDGSYSEIYEPYANADYYNTIIGAEITISPWVKDKANLPTDDQLSADSTLTDVNGNYSISALPYFGNGELFIVKPSFGVHDFDPIEQIVYLGKGDEVVNQLDFTDVSSFTFHGKVLYDTRGVFEPQTVGSKDGTISPDPIYNRYKIDSEFFNMGEYWLNDATGKLDKYVAIALQGANVYIDGEMALLDSEPVLTDADGKFAIEVPIGNHVITVQKEGHVFTRQGRFPEVGEKHSFNANVGVGKPVIFLDETRVVVVGKVVGGKIQRDKVIGFGTIASELEEDYVTTYVASKNNVGVAEIPLYYNSVPYIESTDRQFIIITNEFTGEFREELLPIEYKINSEKVLFTAANNPAKSVMKTTDKFDVSLSEIPEEITPTYNDGNVEVPGVPYHYYLNKLENLDKLIVYADEPVLSVKSQTYDTEIIISDQKVSVADFNFPTPFYTQGKEYEIILQSYEVYTNYDDLEQIEDKMPVEANNIIIENGLTKKNSTPNPDLKQINTSTPDILSYKFTADAESNPSIDNDGNFQLFTNIYYFNGDKKIEAALKGGGKGILLGGSAGGNDLTFATEGPQLPYIILRDPPGSNSSASISEGTSISFNASSSVNTNSGTFGGVNASIGADWEASIFGFAKVSVDVTAEDELNISQNSATNRGNSTAKTYSFSQTISTSDDPDYVGADGDLYIGESNNFYFGEYDNLEFSNTIPQIIDASGTISNMPATNYIELTPEDPSQNTIYLSAQTKTKFFEGSKPSYFIYSQKYILEDLIPKLLEQSLKAPLNADNIDPTTKSKEEYFEQINLWRKLILENEKDKYLALNNAEKLKESLESQVNNYINTLNTAIQTNRNNNPFSPFGEYDERLENILKEKNEVYVKIKDLLDSNFKKNVSLDAGVGEFTKSIESSVVKVKNTEYNLFIDQETKGRLGVQFNGVGVIIEAGGIEEQDIDSALSEEQLNTTTISYTLKDNDKDNLLSVDVINLFDGNGPVFITKGGRTSCPWEDIEKSVFYNNKDYITISQSAAIKNLEESKREKLGAGTQQVEIPVLSLGSDAVVKNVPEVDNAEFILKLQNLSKSDTDIDFKLTLKDSSNPNRAISNIEDNGTIIKVPASGTIDFLLTIGKSSADINDYLDLELVLESLCDDDVTSKVINVSASFVPSCSKVMVSSPRENWVYNIDNAFGTDSDGKITDEPLKIDLTDFNTEFDGLEKIELRYRLATASSWNFLTTYYTESYYRLKEGLNDSDFIPQNIIDDFIIDDKSALTYVDLNAKDFLSAGGDGTYVIQATSICTGDVAYISEVTGTVDLTAPQRFGTPLPIDGILGAGEDFKVNYNEDIFYIDGASTIELKGLKNRTIGENKHDVSLYFEGNNTAEIEKPRIVNGNFSFEFWMKNLTPQTAEAVIFDQEGDNGLKISLNNGQMVVKLGEMQVSATMIVEAVGSEFFHHYAITYNDDTGILKLIIDSNDNPPKDTRATNTQITNNNTLHIGGSTFIGNIHDVRLWGKSLEYNEIRAKIIGNEAGLLGYWPMHEGHGNVAHDLAYFNHAKLKVGWDINPKGTSFEFDKDTYLELNDLGSVFITNTMDATISFWMKTNPGEDGTIFSNGKGDVTDELNPNSGLRNKWAINMTNNVLSLESEGESHALTNANVADNSWHHIALLFNRLGSLKTYVDSQQVSSIPMADIGGFIGNKAWLGARGYYDEQNIEIIDNKFRGKIDEFRFWNTLRNVEQISRDRYNEVDYQSLGLLLYTRMVNDQTYYCNTINGMETKTANKIGQNVGVSNDVPPIKPERDISKLSLRPVIKNNQMVLETEGINWADYEGQILDVTVSNMFDSANNKQESPITWTAFIQQNDVKWYADGFNDIVNLVMESGQEESFDIKLVNRGGNAQPFNIGNVPSWMNLSASSGTISPDSQITITATIDAQLSIGEYIENLSLQTDFGYDQKLQINLRVLAEEPDWKLDPNDFEFSMNIIGKLRINGIFSDDVYDKVAAFSDGEVRGVANMDYNEAYQAYFVFLTVYSNSASADPITFSIWDASNGTILESTIDSDTSFTFVNNIVEGSLSNAALFENTNVVEQQIDLNQGWTWISMNVNDPNFSNLNAFTSKLNLENQDRIYQGSDSILNDAYTKGLKSWGSNINQGGGLSTKFMYKVRFANKQTLNLKGVPVDISLWDFPIKEKWNWLPYPLNKNVSVSEALSLFDAAEDDVIKSQNLFAIYDSRNGWIGTLNYLEEGQGYMIHSSIAQTFKYPNIFGKTSNTKKSGIGNKQAEMSKVFTKYPDNMNAVVLLPEGYDELFIYDDEGELKGQAKNQTIGDRDLSFITIYGDASETLTFHVGNSRNQKATSKQIAFKGNSVLGTVAKPLVLGADILNGLKMYPNPFNKALVLELYSEAEQDMEVKIYNMVGQLVYANNKILKKGNNKIEISPKVNNGIYFLDVYLNGVVSTYKVIKN